MNPEPTQLPYISVILATLNGAATLTDALTALAAQQTGHSFEVIVVDDGSTDATPTIARAAGVRLISHTQNLGQATAHNTALAQARGEIAAFIDDDCVPPPNWLEALGNAWLDSDPEVQAIGGVTYPTATDTLVRRFLDQANPLVPQEFALSLSPGPLSRLRHYLAQHNSPTRHDVRPGFCLVGANMSFRTRAIREVGGFNPDTPGAGEEEDICQRLRNFAPPEHRHQTVMIHPEVAVGHNFDPTLVVQLHRMRSYGFGSGAKWVRDGGIPSLSPGPFLVAGTAGALGLFSPRLGLLGALAAPLVIYRRLTRHFLAHPSVERALYPYLALAQEFSNDIGFVQGWRSCRQSTPTVGQVAPRRTVLPAQPKDPSHG